MHACMEACMHTYSTSTIAKLATFTRTMVLYQSVYLLKRRLHIQFVQRFGFFPNFLLHRGTIFGPNKIPNRLTNWMCRRRFNQYVPYILSLPPSHTLRFQKNQYLPRHKWLKTTYNDNRPTKIERLVLGVEF